MARKNLRKYSSVLFMIAILSLHFLSLDIPKFFVNATYEGLVINKVSYIDVHVEPVTNKTHKTLLIMAEIVNNYSLPVSDVNVTITFYNENSSVIKEIELRTPISVIFSGRRSPFKLGIDLDELKKKGYARYNITVSSFNFYPEGKKFGLEIPHATAKLYPDKTEVKGYIKNVAKEGINNFQIFACLYDENDSFVGVTDAYLFYVPENSEDVLQPGGIQEFIATTRFVNATINVTKCIITGESKEYALLEEKIITSKYNEPPLDYTVLIFLGSIIFLIIMVSLVIIYRKKRKRRNRKKRERRKVRRF